jgi:hypothetical protein
MYCSQIEIPFVNNEKHYEKKKMKSVFKQKELNKKVTKKKKKNVGC